MKTRPGVVINNTHVAFSRRCTFFKRTEICVHLMIAHSTKTKRAGKLSQPSSSSPLIITVEPDGSDTWRLIPVIEQLKSGAVGIIPTDSVPALVCDLENRNAAQLLYTLKGASPSKKLSILCRNFSDISYYTQGFPVSHVPGQPNFFKIAKSILPGPYTLILNASKALPKQVLNFDSGKSKHRSTVGVRIPDDCICQAILEQLDRPLLCTTASILESNDDVGYDGNGLTPDAGVLADVYGPRGLSFIVDAGVRSAELSSVIDLSGSEAALVRKGKGDVSWLDDSDLSPI